MRSCYELLVDSMLFGSSATVSAILVMFEGFECDHERTKVVKDSDRRFG